MEVGVVWGDGEEAAWFWVWGGARRVETRSRPARREMRSARSASRLVVEGWWAWPRPVGPWGR